MTLVDERAATTQGQGTAELRPNPRRWIDRGRDGSGGIMLAGAGLVVTLVVVLVLWVVAAQQPQVDVPSMVGMSRVDAEALLKGMGLKVRATNDQVAAQVPGTVLRTDPSAGQKLDQGGGVTLTLASSAPAVTPSPAVQPSAAQEPPAAPEAPAVQAPPVVVLAPVVPAPVVVPPPVVVVPPPVVQSPPAPALRSVPDVVGFDQYSARRVLVDNGLTVGWVKEEESDQRSGTVLRTDPRAGVALRPGSTVDLVVAEPRQVAVPDVVGLKKASARRVLVYSGLRVRSVIEEESSSRPAGTVLRTDPKAGATVRWGSMVDLVIAKPPATSRPPVTKQPVTNEPSVTGEPPE